MSRADVPVVYVCCFCGDTVVSTDDRVRYLTLQSDPEGGRQDLFADRDCLRRHVHPSVPLLSEMGSPGRVDG